MGDDIESIFKDAEKFNKDGVVYEVKYKDKEFLLSSDFEYIEKVEPENVLDWEYTNNGTITKYIGASTEVIIPNFINGVRIKK